MSSLRRPFYFPLDPKTAIHTCPLCHQASQLGVYTCEACWARIGGDVYKGVPGMGNRKLDALFNQTRNIVERRFLIVMQFSETPLTPYYAAYMLGGAEAVKALWAKHASEARGVDLR